MTEFGRTKFGLQEVDRGKGAALCRTQASVFLSSRRHLGVWGQRVRPAPFPRGSRTGLLITESGGEGLKIRGKRSRWQGCEGQRQAPLHPRLLWAPVGGTHGALSQGGAGKARLETSHE